MWNVGRPRAGRRDQSEGSGVSMPRLYVFRVDSTRRARNVRRGAQRGRRHQSTGRMRTGFSSTHRGLSDGSGFTCEADQRPPGSFEPRHQLVPILCQREQVRECTGTIALTVAALDQDEATLRVEAADPQPLVAASVCPNDPPERRRHCGRRPIAASSMHDISGRNRPKIKVRSNGSSTMWQPP
jgi:hypothetical protein